MAMQDSSLLWQPDYLSNDLIHLRPMLHDDCEELYSIASDPLIWAQHPEPDRYIYDVFRPFFLSAFEHHYPFTILDAASGAAIGSTRYYDYQPANSSIAIGYTFMARSHWGGAYNYACKSLLLDYAFLHIETVLFHIGAVNIRSQKAVQKLGASLVREYTTEKRGITIPQQEYSLSKDTWALQRTR